MHDLVAVRMRLRAVRALRKMRTIFGKVRAIYGIQRPTLGFERRREDLCCLFIVRARRTSSWVCSLSLLILLTLTNTSSRR